MSGKACQDRGLQGRLSHPGDPCSTPYTGPHRFNRSARAARQRAALNTEAPGRPTRLVVPEANKDATMSLPDDVQQGFDRARQAVPAPLVWLHLGEDTLWLVRQQGAGGVASLDLELGTHSTAQLFFKSDPPRPVELERAIDHVEDELMRALVWSGGRATLVTDHPFVRGLAQAEPVLSLETVEALFQRLASGLPGQPSALHGMPAGREAAATLLILRELMHHLRFNQVVVQPSPGA